MAKYDEIRKTMPAELEMAVLGVLRERRGRKLAIGRDSLVRTLRLRGVPAHERQVREAIKNLRRRGALIGSAAGEDGGYYMIEDRGEYLDFKNREFLAKLMDMHETLNAMDKAAATAFGDTTQMNLF